MHGKIKSTEGQYSPFSSVDRIVILPHGMFVAGAGRKTPKLLILTLQIYGGVPSRRNYFYCSQQG